MTLFWHILEAWGVFLLIVYALVAFDIFAHMRQCRRAFRNLFSFLTEEE